MDVLSRMKALICGLFVFVIIVGFTGMSRTRNCIWTGFHTNWQVPAKTVVRQNSIKARRLDSKPLLQNGGPVVLEGEGLQYPGELWHGYQLPVLVSYPRGRLGNVMGEYATLYAMKYIYNATVFTIDEMRDTLSMFPRLSLPPLPVPFNSSDFKPIYVAPTLYRNDYRHMEYAAAGLLGPYTFLIDSFPFEIHLFDKFKEEIRREFTFAPSIQEEARQILRTVITKWQHEHMRNITPVLVGFHVRRTDYEQHLLQRNGGLLPNETYYSRAIEYYRGKFSFDVAFVASSDDMNYVHMYLGHHPDVYFAPGQHREIDLAVLSSCNHSIVTVGSFGFWTGYLTGGEVVYPDLKLRTGYKFSREMYEIAGLDNFTVLPTD